MILNAQNNNLNKNHSNFQMLQNMRTQQTMVAIDGNGHQMQTIQPVANGQYIKNDFPMSGGGHSPEHLKSNSFIQG
jgi:hypothetical protein